MKKVCKTCGYVPESDIRECPNCGSYDFEPIRDKNQSYSDRFKRFM